MMIKYLGPREFDCAVITALLGPFSLCLRGHLSVSSQQSRGWKGFSCLYRRAVYVDVKLSEICGGAGREGLPVGLLWRDSVRCQQHE